MLTSLGIIFICGLLGAAVFQRLRLPRIIGMLAAGIIVGPYALNILSPEILGISAELRKLALIIILIRAGLSLDVRELRRVGRPALMMAFVPASLEILGYVLLAPVLLGITRAEAAVMGAVMGAVSPAVVVPRMLRLMDEGYGAKHSVPQLIMAGASCDDVFVIVLFTSFMSMAQGESAGFGAILQAPVSILLGAAVGEVCGLAAEELLKLLRRRGKTPGENETVITALALALLLCAVESMLSGRVPFSGLLAVMGMACMTGQRAKESAQLLSERFGRLWSAAEILFLYSLGRRWT